MLSRRYGLLALVCFGMLSACTGIKTYPNHLDKNLVIKTETDSGSLISSVKASLDIYDVSAECKPNYIGTVKLDQPNVEVGLKPGRVTYLSFRFNSSGFLSSSSSTISLDTLIKPRKSFGYDAKVRYQNDIYNVEIFEIRPNNSQRRELAMHTMRDCKKL